MDSLELEDFLNQAALEIEKTLHEEIEGSTTAITVSSTTEEAPSPSSHQTGQDISTI